MVVVNEQRVSALADRVGLQLAAVSGANESKLYQLVEPQSKTSIYPGGNAAGVALCELEEWLEFPWE